MRKTARQWTERKWETEKGRHRNREKERKEGRERER